MTGGLVPWERGGDLLLLFSDGITEARNDAGEPFGETRVIDVVRRVCALPAEGIVEAVFAEVDAYSRARFDDQTVVVLKA
jgi:sigma-B regulation protein RsbU (phosphoserine phosphatase)